MSKHKVSLSDLEVEASITIDVSECASSIEIKCADWLKPAPKGIYSNSQVDPVMVDGGNYYTVSKGPKDIVRTPVSDLDALKKIQTIYTSKGDKDFVVVTAQQLQNKDKCLSTLPIRPYRGVKILECLLNHQINSYLAYNKSRSDLFEVVSRHFDTTKLDQSDDEVCFEYITDEYKDIRTDVFNFMGNKNWHIYFLKIKGTTVTLQRSIDWRAYDWMCKMDSGEWK